MPARSERLALALTAALAGFPALAAEPPWPSKEAIDRARDVRPFPDVRAIERAPVSRPPNIGSASPGADIEALAKQHAEAKRAFETPIERPSLRIFVTLDMPGPSLQGLADQAARAGATLVLRGLKDQSMRATLARLQGLTGDRNVAWEIDPEAFTRFGVERAPTFVLMTGARAAEPGCSSECPTQPSFVAIAGDVTLDYALRSIVRQAPAARPHAAPYLARLTDLP